jgi:hypothetical protein
MLGPGKANRARASATARCDADADIYDRYADGLSREALLPLGDVGLAEQVVCDVIADDCTRVPPSAGGASDAGYRLPVAAYRRCQGNSPAARHGTTFLPGGACLGAPHFFPWNLTPADREAWSRPPRPG